MKNKETSKTNKKTPPPKETVWDEELISRDDMNALNDTLDKKVEFKL